ncbi:C-type lectin domain family 4 member A-like isoform X4 [Grammomys surdaster]|uniref:C-type lectin domain family 4 member A-like isoform X4 n=1 Tax=Grammomys surdaster TaxID=491861 RepID=UPI00109F9B13|nr:C-type lectin domain family 4 member A-like isoform X4 [Grammomys surdaster]
MVQERNLQGKGVCWSLRLWSAAVISILLLSTCFIAHCVDKVWSCCPKDWKLLGSHCYLVPTVTSTDSAASWMKSEEKCSQMGAHLLVIHSQKEQDFITNILSTHAAYFIGLRDSGHRQWQWVDQTPYDESATFWHKGEPSSEDEKCVILNHRNDQWGWNDIPCNHKHKSVCQMKKIYL